LSTTEEQLKRIQEKLQRLLKNYAQLEKENQELKQSLDRVKKDESSQTAVISQLRQQVDVLKFSNGEMSDEDKKQFQKKINSYLKEIDRCIGMLSE
jgi:chromosome segregation ATPase